LSLAQLTESELKKAPAGPAPKSKKSDTLQKKADEPLESPAAEAEAA
jgi:hypothetical protein